MRRTKVKVCGVTQASQVSEIVELSVDAIGVILHAKSPRLVSVDMAKEIRKQIPAFITMVGVFVDCDEGQVNQMSREIGLDLIQLHGAESAEYSSQIQGPYIKAIRAKNVSQVVAEIDQHSEAKAILLDPYVPGQHGGTGQPLDERAWPSEYSGQTNAKKLILAGGLAPDNILARIGQFHPYGVDLNSGVELSPGVKDIERISACLELIDR